MRNILVSLVVLAIVATAAGSPGLLITKPPVQPVPSWTGPPIDPHAVQGQWFRDLSPQVEQVRPYEFYDNRIGFGGGFRSTLAIEGYVNNMIFDGQGNVTGFSILTTITNDMPSATIWEVGANSHGEYLSTAQQYQGPMRGVKLTTSFADDGVLGNFPGPAGPYKGSETSQNIYAIEYDELAWYCWTPGNADPAKVPWGSYMVPTYDFPDMLPGQSATRNLGFGLYAPTGPGTPLYSWLMEAEAAHWDVLLNRTLSLKISDYFDALTQDTGAPYPIPPLASSDVSVFFFPEPATLTLCLLGLAAIRRR